MNAKKSFFNRTIFLKNIRQFWPVCILYLVLLLCFLGMGITQNPGTYTDGGIVLSYLFLFRGWYILFIILIFSAFFAGISFRYVFFRKSSDTIHALPVTKTSLFISNAASGLLMLLVPQIIYFIVSMLMTGFELGKIPWEYWGFSLAMLVCSIFFYALALVCIMVSGHLIAFPVLYLLINIAAASISTILQLFMQLLLFGFDMSSFSFNLSFLSPLAYMASKMNALLGSSYNSVAYYYSLLDSSQASEFYLTVLWYVLAGVVLILLSLFLYHKRKAEKCGTPITFSSLSYVIKLTLPLYAALCITYFFYTTLNAPYVYYKPEDTLLLLVIFIVSSGVCSLLTEMLLRKSFRIPKKGLLGSTIFTFFVLICGFLIRLDAFGITSRLPDAADVTEVSFAGNDANISSVITDPEIIQEVIDMNRQIIQEENTIIKECNKMAINSNSGDSLSGFYGGYSYNSNGYLYTVRFNYLLKNKKTVSRTYTLPVFPEKMDNTNSYAAKLQGFVSNPEYMLAAMHQLEEKSNSFNSINLFTYEGTLLQMLEDTPVSDDATYVYQVNDYSYSYNTNSSYIAGSDIENIQKMYEAIQKDVKNGTLRPIKSLDFRDVREYFQVDISYTILPKDTIVSEAMPLEYGGSTSSYIATKNCKNILAVYQDILTSNHDEESSSKVATEARRLCETYGYHVSRYDFMDTVNAGAKIFSSIQEVCIQGGYPAMTLAEGNDIYRYNYVLKETNNGAISLCILTDTMLGTGEYVYKDTETTEEIYTNDSSMETYIEADVQILGAYLYHSGDVTPIKPVSDTEQLTTNTDPILDLEVVP